MEAHAAELHHHGPPAAHQSSRINREILGMFLFIASEIMLFGAFFTAYFFVRVVNGTQWPTPPFHLPVFVALVNTCILGAQPTIFFCLTGLHGAHVFVGLTLLLFATIRAFRGHFTPEQHHGVEIPGIYWHFVDVMWIVVYTTVYII